MGIIDQRVYTITCINCSIEESGVVVDKGSSWNGSSWSNRTDFKNFDVKWEVIEQGAEPKAVEAVCKACGDKVNIKSCYRV